MGAAAGVGAGTSPALCRPGIEGLSKEIETAILAELPGVTRVQITYDPANEKIPLMILAFRV